MTFKLTKRKVRLHSNFSKSNLKQEKTTKMDKEIKVFKTIKRNHGLDYPHSEAVTKGVL